mmetsp:Transcript_17368/g.51969  ORF Transcript_17368/g.51969 Transcript_17368/m.51969 type:complete len:158 (-) Transcript_17368:1225-1698(-)
MCVQVHSLLGEGSVVGVIPKELEPREVSGEAVGEVRIVRNMHERKAIMAMEASAFICLPGGFGTLEEGVEVLTWSQLGFHTKPVAVLNINGFYDHLLAFFDHCVTEGFIRDTSRQILISDSTPAGVLDKLEAYQGGQQVKSPRHVTRLLSNSVVLHV